MAEQEIFQSNFTAEQIEYAIRFFNSQVAEPYRTDLTYKGDEFVIYDGLLYQCIVNQEEGETTKGQWDPTKWQLQKVFDNNGYVIIQAGTYNKNID